MTKEEIRLGTNSNYRILYTIFVDYFYKRVKIFQKIRRNKIKYNKLLYYISFHLIHILSKINRLFPNNDIINNYKYNFSYIYRFKITSNLK